MRNSVQIIAEGTEMGTIRAPLPVKPIIGVLTAEPLLLSSVYQRLTRRFGPVDWQSALLPFTSTTYYAAEMGENLQRQFISFERLMDAGALAAMKVFTNQVEETFAREGTHRRRVNLDAGYVDSAKLVLASTKDHAHRIYLGEGIYAEITLRFHRKTFQPWAWTYPDYRSQTYIELFNHIRAIYREQLV